ncbi:MAG: hypothetical protein EAZ55_09125 [Cytophagales bacterium]|nr:MAG: hypothetical protein EAZ55_09125 [Cytophagales bacterium]
MKTEIVNFVKDLPQEVFSYNLSLDEGLYIFVDLDENGNLISFEKGVYKKPKPKTPVKKDNSKKAKKNEASLFSQEKNDEEIFEEETEMNPFFKRCLDIQSNIQPVAQTKIFNPIKKIFNASCTGFTLVFNKKNLYKEENKVKYFRKDEILESLKEYFNSAKQYIFGNFEERFFDAFQKFTFRYFSEKNIPYSLQKIFINAKNDFKVSIYFRSLVLDKCGRAYLTTNSSNETYQRYVDNKIFNKDVFNIIVEKQTYGIADSLSTFNDKKAFLKHKTALFELNYRLTSQEAKMVWQFFELRGRKILSNPLPIFIDKKELNEKAVAIVKEDEQIRYSEIIKKLFEETKSDLGNYYLLFFQKGELIDLDFVPSFQYEIKDMQIEEIFPLGGKVVKKIENVFEFEREISNRIFNGQLVNETKAGGLWLKYFDEIKYDQKYMTLNTFNQVLKYRKAFYDYVYKSKRESIQDFMFHDIMLKGILDDLRADEYDNKKKSHSKWYPIREKLNIWFSLYEYFNFNLKQEKPMASRIKEHLDMMQKLVKGEQQLQNDDEFAFATGQVIAYLYSKSESADRSYSRLEPFLQKVDCIKLQEAIKNAFNTYKHKAYSNNFKKPFADVMDYRTDRNLQELMPTILAGFFANNTLFAEKENDEVSTIENNF